MRWDDVPAVLFVTGWAVAQTCCISQCAKYRKSEIFGYPWKQTPEPITMKLGVRNYVQDSTPASKYGSDRAAWGLGACVKYHCL